MSPPDETATVSRAGASAALPPAADWVCVLGVAAAVRALAVAQYVMIGTDGMHHLRMAEQIARGDVGTAWANPVQYPPGYASLIAAARLATGGAAGWEAAAVAVSAVAGALLVLPVMALARWAYGRHAALWAGLGAAFHPELIRLSADVMTENPFLLLQATAAACAVWGARTGAWRAWALAGTAAAAALWIRAEGIYAAALIAGTGAAAAWRSNAAPAPASDARTAEPPAPSRSTAAGRALRAALALAVLLVLYLPYLAWIHETTGRWHFTTKTSVVVTADLAAGDPAAQAHERPISPARAAGALLKSTGWTLLPWMALGVAVTLRRRVWNAGALAPLALAAAGCALPFAAHLLSRYAHSPRYYLQGTFFLLPAAGFGIASAVEWAGRRRPARPLALRALAAVLVGVTVAAAILRTQDRDRASRAGLREAGEWIRATAGPGRWLMATHEQAAYYAGTDLVHCPRTYAALERKATAAPGRLLVLLESDFDELEAAEPGFRRKLEAGPLERLAAFPAEARAGKDRAVVYQSR